MGDEGDNVEDAERQQFKVSKGDILVLHNHGVENNMHSKEFIHVIEHEAQQGPIDGHVLAKKIAERAKHYMHGKEHTPYSLKTETDSN